jgi:hypothetical protein
VLARFKMEEGTVPLNVKVYGVRLRVDIKLLDSPHMVGNVRRVTEDHIPESDLPPTSHHPLITDDERNSPRRNRSSIHVVSKVKLGDGIGFAFAASPGRLPT